MDWTKNGRTLLSACGDGTVRLSDTQAVGPYGELSNVTVHQKGDSSHTVGGPASTSLSTVIVPGSKAESLVKVGGAALSVYRGHAPSTPVWGVSSAPCGYYFASAGSDYTARIWATDRTSPIRVLSGHVSPSVNCVSWHPNCNYVVTASDDKTCRMFDIQTGRCVRLLSGSTRDLNLVRVSPSGRYAAGSGYVVVVVVKHPSLSIFHFALIYKIYICLWWCRRYRRYIGEYLTLSLADEYDGSWVVQGSKPSTSQY